MSSGSKTTENVFEVGKYETVLRTVESGSKSEVAVPPPTPLLIATPSEAGEFPLLVFLHGYLLSNSFYSQLIQHIASHGFIVIAPKLYTLAGSNTTVDINSTVATTNWLPEGLPHLLPPHVEPNMRKLGLAGHSRGGKAAFAVVLEKAALTSDLKFSALIGIDPVDGFSKGSQTPPPVLTYVPHSFDLDLPAMVIGTELGEIGNNFLFCIPASAPKGVNHEDFFNECQKPACHFFVKGYGHCDMLDDDIGLLDGRVINIICKSGKSRKPMRRFVGGIVVAFMKAWLLGDDSDLLAIRDGHETAPVELKTIEFLE